MSTNEKPAAKVFFDGCAEGQFLLQKCGAHGHLQYPPGPLCRQSPNQVRALPPWCWLSRILPGLRRWLHLHPLLHPLRLRLMPRQLLPPLP